MFNQTQYSEIFSIICMIAISIIIFFCLIRIILGPRYTDRIVGANMISTKVIAFICLLAVLLGEDFYLDIALIYSLLGFVAVVVLSKIITIREQKYKEEHMDLEDGVTVIDRSEEEENKK